MLFRSIPPKADKAAFIELAIQYSSKTINKGWLSYSVNGSDNPSVSLSPQFDGYVGTITLPSKEHKESAMKNNDTEWRLDDVFNGVTVLYSPEEPDLEYKIPSFSYLVLKLTATASVLYMD